MMVLSLLFFVSSLGKAEVAFGMSILLETGG